MEIMPATNLPKGSVLVWSTNTEDSTDVYESPDGTRYIYEGDDLYKVIERVGFAAVPDAHLNSYTE